MGGAGNPFFEGKALGTRLGLPCSRQLLIWIILCQQFHRHHNVIVKCYLFVFSDLFRWPLPRVDRLADDFSKLGVYVPFSYIKWGLYHPIVKIHNTVDSDNETAECKRILLLFALTYLKFITRYRVSGCENCNISVNNGMYRVAALWLLTFPK